MPRPKGVGQNRPKKMKVVVPSLAEVRLVVRGYVPEPSREPDSERGQPDSERAQPSPGKLHVSRLERYAFILHKEAEQVRAAYDKAIAKHKIDERVYDANLRSLERRKASTSLSVLDKRERKLRDLIEDHLYSKLELMGARAANAEAFAEAESFSVIAKKASIDRLQRLLARAKK